MNILYCTSSGWTSEKFEQDKKMTSKLYSNIGNFFDIYVDRMQWETPLYMHVHHPINMALPIDPQKIERLKNVIIECKNTGTSLFAYSKNDHQRITRGFDSQELSERISAYIFESGAPFNTVTLPSFKRLFVDDH